MDASIQSHGCGYLEPNYNGSVPGKLPSMALDSGFPAGMTDFWRWLKFLANQDSLSSNREFFWPINLYLACLIAVLISSMSSFSETKAS